MHTTISSASRPARGKRITICGALALVVACISGAEGRVSLPLYSGIPGKGE